MFSHDQSHTVLADCTENSKIYKKIHNSV